MSSNPTPQDDARLDLLWDYLHGELADEQHRAFEANLRDNPDLVGAGVDLIELMVMARDVFQQGEAVREEAMYSSVAEDDESSKMQALAELARLEQEAPAETVVLDQGLVATRRTTKTDRPALTSSEWRSAGSYLFSHAIRSKAATVTAFAAMLVLGLVLYLALVGEDNTPATPETANNTPSGPNEPGRVVPGDTPVFNTIVATLTAERDAVWDRRPGEDLFAGQRFELYKGFAEITTNHGAVAILEAPASIEFIDNDNALRLHSGKLVGICETASSKGFTVRTPHMEITDLGTRFGVDASMPGITEVHVHQGEVVVAAPQSSAQPRPTPRRVTEQQAVRNGAIPGRLVSIAPVFDRFDPALSTYRLRSTGLHLPEGEVDPHWQIVADANGLLDTPARVIVKRSKSERFGHFDAPGNDPDVAQWLFFGSTRSAYYPYDPPAGLDSSRLVLETSVHVPDTIDLQDKVLYLRYAYDEGLDALQINGQTTELPKKPLGKGGNVLFHEVDVPIEHTALRHGDNTVRVDLSNNITSNLFSFYLQWELRPASTDNTTEGETQP